MKIMQSDFDCVFPQTLRVIELLFVCCCRVSYACFVVPKFGE